MSHDLDKEALLDAVRDRLQSTLADLQREADAARAGTRVDGDHRPDSRGERAAVTAQGYLTGALQGRIGQVQAALRHLDQVAPGPRHKAAVGALVEVEDLDGRATTYLIAPGASGERLPGGVLAISPASPIGRALRGTEPGDAVDVARGDDVLELEVVSVS